MASGVCPMGKRDGGLLSQGLVDKKMKERVKLGKAKESKKEQKVPDHLQSLVEKGVDATKLSMLESAMGTIQKEFGKDAVDFVSRFGDGLNIPKESTGLIALDAALGGGLPRGDYIEIFGKPQVGKTTLCYYIMGQLQKRGNVVAFIDQEQDFDPTWARINGLDVDSMIISQPDSLEQALTIVEGLIKSTAVDLIVIDSLAALTPRKVVQGSLDDDTIGLKARKMAQFFDKTKHFVKETNTIVLFTNQWRESPNMFVKSDSPGGWSAKHHFGIRMEVSRRGADMIKQGDEIIAQKSEVLTVKNKVSAPYRRASFRIDFDTGLNGYYDLLDYALQFGFVKKSGSWYSYNDQNIAQGENNTIDYLRQNPDVFDEINAKVRELVFANA